MKRKSQAIFSRVKLSFKESLCSCKGRIILIGIITLLCFIAGIVIFCSSKTNFLSNEYILSISGIKTGLGAFFSRSFSIIVVFGVCYICSLRAFTMPIGVLVLSFRGYLLGFNICGLCSNFGMSGLLQTIFIVLPCQILLLAVMVMFLSLISKANSNCKKFGSKSESRGKMFLIFLLICLIINVVETVLLSLFSSNIILVI